MVDPQVGETAEQIVKEVEKTVKKAKKQIKKVKAKVQKPKAKSKPKKAKKVAKAPKAIEYGYSSKTLASKWYKKLGWKLKQPRVPHKCSKVGCSEKTPGSSNATVWCAKHRKELRTFQLAQNNIPYRENGAKATKQPKVVYNGELTVWAMEHPDKARKLLSEDNQRQIHSKGEFDKLLQKGKSKLKLKAAKSKTVQLKRKAA